MARLISLLAGKAKSLPLEIDGGRIDLAMGCQKLRLRTTWWAGPSSRDFAAAQFRVFVVVASVVGCLE
jgi:hypothetical protein